MRLGNGFFLPFNFLRLSFAYFTLADFLCLASLFLRLCRGNLPTYALLSGTTYWVFGVLLMVTGFLLSSLLNGDPIRGLIVTFQYMHTFLLLPLVVLGRSWEQTIALVKALCASVFLMCIFGVYVIHIDGQRNTAFVSGSGRLQSFVERENEAASVIAMTTPLLLWLWISGAIRPLFALLGLVAMLYGTMLTGSNTGLLTLAAALAAFLAVALSGRSLMGAVALGATTITAMLTVGRDYLPPVFQRRVLGALESGNLDEAGTFSHRFQLMLESIGVARDTILLGLGANQYRVQSFWEQPVHNAYLLLWTEGGLLSLVGLVLALCGGFVTGLAPLMRPGGRVYAAAAICVLGPFILLINAAPHIYGRFWMGPVFCGLAIATCFTRLGHAPRGKPLIRARQPRAAA